MDMNMKTLMGCFAVFGSAIVFYLASVVIKMSKSAGLHIDASFFVFVRFLLGFVSVVCLILFEKKKIQIKKPGIIFGRTVFNMVAAYCFFQAVATTSVSEANILNMTYPLFIAVFSWVFLKEQRDFTAVVIVIAAFIGVWLILAPGKMGFKIESLWGLTSGVSAAIGLIYLNLSMRDHDTETTLFVMFGLGTVLMFIIFHNNIFIPSLLETKYLLMCSAFAIAGQYLLTIGFKYVTAVEGGIISSTRILIAALLGPIIAADPALSFSGWIGAFLIFSGNVYLTVRKTKAASGRNHTH
ncbi:MAG: DMT family transporter [Desulfobacteraceae bacterium]|nr:DMT family transporter [Desulfobacteraceae bacterium]